MSNNSSGPPSSALSVDPHSIDLGDWVIRKWNNKPYYDAFVATWKTQPYMYVSPYKGPLQAIQDGGTIVPLPLQDWQTRPLNDYIASNWALCQLVTNLVAHDSFHQYPWGIIGTFLTYPQVRDIHQWAVATVQGDMSGILRAVYPVATAIPNVKPPSVEAKSTVWQETNSTDFLCPACGPFRGTLLRSSEESCYRCGWRK